MTEKQTFEKRFRRFAAVRRRLLNQTLAFRLARLALAAGAAALVLLSGWLPNAFVNLALFALLALFLIVLAVKYMLGRTRFRSWLVEAFEMESLAGDLNSRLISAWDFFERQFFTPLTRAVIGRAEADLTRAYEAQLDRQEHRRRGKQLTAALVVFIALGLTPWFAFGRVADNFWQSWAAVRDALFPVRYVAEPASGTHYYRLGEQVPVRLAFERPGFEHVDLVRVLPDERVERTTLSVDPQGVVAHTITSDVETELKVHFEFGNRRTETAALVFTTPPALVNMQTELIPPSYTQLLPRTLEGVQQRLVGLKGTRITLGFTFSKDLESAEITWDDGSKLDLEVVGRFASVNLLHVEARQASLQATSIHGFSMEAPLAIDFDLQNDEKPRLFLPKHLVEDMPVLPTAVPLFGFGIRAEDDYGVTKCVLLWQKSTVDNPTKVTANGEIERAISPSRKITVNFEKILEGMSLVPGDRIGLQVEVWDNRDPDKQPTRSRRFSLFVYQEDLGGLTIKQLGFGSEAGRHGRIAKSTRATMVKSPEGRRNAEKVRNEHQGNVASVTRPPTVRGEHSQATLSYFRLLSGVSYEKNQQAPQRHPGSGNAASDSNEPPPPESTTPPTGSGATEPTTGNE